MIQVRLIKEEAIFLISLLQRINNMASRRIAENIKRAIENELPEIVVEPEKEKAAEEGKPLPALADWGEKEEQSEEVQ